MKYLVGLFSILLALHTFHALGGEVVLTQIPDVELSFNPCIDCKNILDFAEPIKDALVTLENNSKKSADPRFLPSQSILNIKNLEAMFALTAYSHESKIKCRVDLIQSKADVENQMDEFDKNFELFFSKKLGVFPSKAIKALHIEKGQNKTYFYKGVLGEDEVMVRIKINANGDTHIDYFNRINLDKQVEIEGNGELAQRLMAIEQRERELISQDLTPTLHYQGERTVREENPKQPRQSSKTPMEFMELRDSARKRLKSSGRMLESKPTEQLQHMYDNERGLLVRASELQPTADSGPVTDRERQGIHSGQAKYFSDELQVGVAHDSSATDYDITGEPRYGKNISGGINLSKENMAFFARSNSEGQQDQQFKTRLQGEKNSTELYYSNQGVDEKNRNREFKITNQYKSQKNDMTIDAFKSDTRTESGEKSQTVNLTFTGNGEMFNDGDVKINHIEHEGEGTKHKASHLLYQGEVLGLNYGLSKSLDGAGEVTEEQAQHLTYRGEKIGLAHSEVHREGSSGFKEEERTHQLKIAENVDMSYTQVDSEFEDGTSDQHHSKIVNVKKRINALAGEVSARIEQNSNSQQKDQSTNLDYLGEKFSLGVRKLDQGSRDGEEQKSVHGGNMTYGNFSIDQSLERNNNDKILTTQTEYRNADGHAIRYIRVNSNEELDQTVGLERQISSTTTTYYNRTWRQQESSYAQDVGVRYESGQDRMSLGVLDRSDGTTGVTTEYTRTLSQDTNVSLKWEQDNRNNYAGEAILTTRLPAGYDISTGSRTSSEESHQFFVGVFKQNKECSVGVLAGTDEVEGGQYIHGQMECNY